MDLEERDPGWETNQHIHTKQTHERAAYQLDSKYERMKIL